ncbi:unnamed protein product [Adineta ricciae]|uniref:CUE domain-containing protein n=1 Tax=Adineta ricciae TaxID=249248 RepID=A0A814YHK1_ADIRI|nr:unnamed protein product [Adineta ricciae]CAF1229615.1 unnamed protein product [Adineta ricciae]
MAASSRSATIVELKRMFSNLDSSVIESVLSANRGQVDVTIDQLLTMAIDTENQNNIHQAVPHTPLRQLPVVPNIYDDDPPPYPGHEREASASNHSTTMQPFSQSSTSLTPHSSENSDYAKQDLQVRRWKTSDGHYRTCYIGDLPDDFLCVKFLSKSELHHQSKHISGNFASQCIDDDQLAVLFEDEAFINELRRNKDFLSTLQSDQGNRSISASATKQRRSTNLLSNKPPPLPTPPTIEIPKTPKVRATMLQNVLTQIEQGRTMKTSMVPEELVTQDEGYSYGKNNTERIPLPPAPLVAEFDPARPESNEEFIGRLKHMGKNSMEKFTQLARRFSTRKEPTGANAGKYSKQPIITNTIDRQRLNNDFDSDDDPISMNSNNPSRYLAPV